MEKCDVAIVGAGPYGLSAAAHLRHIKGLDVRTFGRPMSFWKDHVACGTHLLSSCEVLNLSDPQDFLTLQRYQPRQSELLSRDGFVAYGQWFCSQAVPDVDVREVKKIEREGTRFRLVLSDESLIEAARVIIASGILGFTRRPPEFSGLQSLFVSHSCDHSDLSLFSGRRVLVIGGGQSALESAALLHENGAEVEVAVRAPMIRWRSRRSGLLAWRPLASALYAASHLGSAGLSQLVDKPQLFTYSPQPLRTWLSRRATRAGAASWLQPRLASVRIHTGKRVRFAQVVGEQVRVAFIDGDTRYVHHVFLATGYRVDISRYGFFTDRLLRSISTKEGSPCLNASFESSVAGLYFLGATAAQRFGPLMHSVAGTRLAAKRVSAAVQSSFTPRLFPVASNWEGYTSSPMARCPSD